MKKEIRSQIMNDRLALTQSEVNSKSHSIFENILSLDIMKPFMNVLVYMDFRNEVMTKEVIAYILDNHMTLLLPRVNKDTNTLSIHKIESLDSLEKSKYGILEPPVNSETVEYNEIDLILAPGVAFDYNCYRLGYGGGFYDKLLSNIRKDAKVIALAFDIQLVESVPTESHDKQMDFVITESNIITS